MIPSAAEIAFYRENGFVHLKNVLPAAELREARAAILAKVRELTRESLPLDQRDTYGKAFLQVMNLWRHSEAVRRFAFDERLARMAAALMGCAGTRLYHDQALFKEPGGGVTPWHADQYYWPLASDHATTAWIPLVDVTLDMGPLAFCPRSHRIEEGRDLAISDESEAAMQQRLAELGIVEEPFALGDVSFHGGWTFHRAGANRSAAMREVFTVIYLDRDMRLARPRNANQQADREAWCPGVAEGEVIASELNPVLFGGR